MSVNWVMLSETEGFVKLPSERIFYTSPPRTSLWLATPDQYPGNDPFWASSSTGCVHLTNQRLVYLPAAPTPQLQSFTAPLLNIHNSHVSAPFFGPNVWEADIRPVTGGGLPGYRVVLKLTFKDGGAYDFSQVFERLQERLRQVVEVASEDGDILSNMTALESIRFANVHLEELPRYTENTESAPQTAPAAPLEIPILAPTALHPTSSNSSSASGQAHSPPEQAPAAETFTAPSEPPPNYEEVQRQSVAEHLEESMRRAEEDGTS